MNRCSQGLCLVTQSCPTLCDPVDCSPPGSCVHGILQARILEWVAISFSSIEVRIVLIPNNDQWVPASLDAVLRGSVFFPLASSSHLYRTFRVSKSVPQAAHL